VPWPEGGGRHSTQPPGGPLALLLRWWPLLLVLFSLHPQTIRRQ